MLLTIDIGNTNLTLGLYNGSQLGPRWRVATNHDRMPDEYGIQFLAFLQHSQIQAASIEGICMASVVPPLTEKISEACQNYLGQAPLVVDNSVIDWIPIRYSPPDGVGADRLVDAVAVIKRYSVPACVVDFGTATTFDGISVNSEYLGGAIAPGIGIAADALFSRTAKLPRVELKRPPHAIGANTVHAMQSGLLFGYVGMVEGMVARFRKELGDGMRVIATGGLAEIISRETDVIDVLAPWLTLDGLFDIWQVVEQRRRNGDHGR